MNPKILRRRLPFYEERLKHESKVKRNEMNLSGWLNGLYVYRSLAGLSGKPYVSEPLDIFKEEIGNEPKEVIEQKVNNAADGFRAYAILFNREMKKKKRKEVQENGEHRQSVDTTDSIDKQGECRTDQTDIETERTE